MESSEQKTGITHSRPALGALLFHVGLVTLVVQSLLAREFLVLFHGSEATLGVFYASWLLWIGVGASAYFAIRPLRAHLLAWLPAIPILLPFAGWAALRGMEWARGLSGIPAAELIPFSTLATITLCTTAIVGLPAGLCFAQACHAAEGDDRSRHPAWVAALFGFEALGGFVGGLLYTFVLLGRIPTEGILAILAALGGTHTHIWALKVKLPSRQTWATVGTLVALAGVYFSATPPGREAVREHQRASFEARHPGFHCIETLDSRHDRLVVAQRDGHRALFAGSAPVYLPEASDARRLAALAIAQVPSGARSVLIVGHAMPALERALLTYPSVHSLATVALDRELNRLILANADAPKTVERIAMDPRTYLNHPPRGAGYDLILVVAPDPISAYANRFYTAEFFRRVKMHLSGRGVLVTGVTAAANYLGNEVGDYAGSVIRTVREVFGREALGPGDRLTILAGAPTISVDARKLAARYPKIAGPNSAFDPAGFATLLPPRDVEQVRDRFAKSDAPINHDARPTAYYLGAIVWTRFSGSDFLRATLDIARRIGIWIVLAPLIALFVARLGHVALDTRSLRPTEISRFNAVATIAIVGAVSMALSLMLLLAYQSAIGYLFGRIALLASLYMLGLAIGSLAPRRWRASPIASRWLLVAALAMLAVGLPIAAHVATPGATGGGVFMALLFAGGLLSGSAFALAAIACENLPGRTGASLDAADHAGGATGALITGTLLLPLFGLRAAMWVGAAALVGLILLHLQAMLLARLVPGRSAPRDPLRAFGWVLVAIVASAWFIGYHARPRTIEEEATTQAAQVHEPYALDRSQLPDLPEGRQWEKRVDPFAYWTAPTADGKTRRIVVTTDQTAPNVHGFVGPITLALEIDNQRIRNIALLHMQETPSYVRALPTWLQRFRGLPAHHPLRLGADIDAMTGATVSSVAVVETINRTLDAVAPLTGTESTEADWSGEPAWRRLVAPAPLSLLAAFLLFLPVYYRGTARTRRLFLLLIAGGIGYYFNRQFSIIDPASAALGDIPGMTRPAGIVLLIGVGVIAVLWGAGYCGYLCPFGALQELAASLSGADRRRPFLAGPLRNLRSLRYILLAVALTGFFLSWGDSRWLDWDILQTAFRAEKSVLAWGVIAFFVVASAIIPRLWCLYLCPAGAFLSLFNRFALLRRTPLFRKVRYGACDLGATASRPRDCLRCNRCLVLDARPAPLSKPHALFATVLIALAILALGVLYYELPVEREAQQTAPETQEAPPEGEQTRSSEAQALDEAIRSGRLSDREAMYYGPAEVSPLPTPEERTRQRRRRGKR